MREKAAILFMVLAGIASAAFGVLEPLLTRVFTDRILGGGDHMWLMPLLCLTGILAIAQMTLGMIQADYLNITKGRIIIESSCGYVYKLLHLPMKFYSQRAAGDLLARQRENEKAAGIWTRIIAPLAVSAISIVFYLMVMLSISPMLSLIGIVSLLIDLLVGKIITAQREKITHAIARDTGVLSGKTAEILNMMESVKAGGMEDGFFAEWAGQQAKVNEGYTQIYKLNTYLGSIPWLLMKLANVALLSVGVLLIMQGHFTAGSLLAMQSFLANLMTPAQKLIDSGAQIQQMRTSMERIADVTEQEEDPVFCMKDPSPIDICFGGHIQLKNITFGYVEGEAPLIENFSLELTPGKRIALVGGSGSGKSTVAKLIAGLYQPWTGEILYDGKPIWAYTREAFTGSIGVIDQDIVLFAESIRENLCLADGTLWEGDMIPAARDACIHDTIMQRPEGYETQLAEGGHNFSGGQRQQIEIARALTGNPTVLILDEATSALDARTEDKVMKAIKARGAAMLIVAHRLSTVRDADEIIVLDKGHVVERGTHEELMALGGEYARLVTAA